MITSPPYRTFLLSAFRSPALAAAIAALSGCYSNYTLRSTPAAERQVTVTLTEAGTRALAPTLGDSVVSIDGRVLSASGTALVVAVARLVYEDEHATSWRGESVTVPAYAVESVEGRRFSVLRTALVTGGIIAAVYLLSQAFSINIPPDY